MNKLRKLLAASTLFAMVVAAAPFNYVAAASTGDLIKMNGVSSVYYLKDGKRFVFPNEATYFSWYSDWNNVKTVSSDELSSYPLGGNVTMRPGTKLVKITTNPTVYAVEANGTLRAITSEDQAKALFGTNWAKMVVDVADAFFINYTIGSALPTDNYPAGQIVNPKGTNDLYYWDGANYRKFADESALLANGFSFNYVVTTDKTISPVGSAITGAETALMNVAQNATTGQTTTGPVISGSATIAIDSTTPAAGNVPKNTPVDMMKINVTAGNDGDASLTGIKFTSIGLGNYGDIDGVTVYADGKKLGNSRDVDSNKTAQINFYNSLVIPKGTTKTLVVRATLADTQNYGLAINAAADVAANSVISGTFPIKSNIMSGVAVTVGALTMDSDGTLSNIKLGDKDATVAKFKLTNNNVEDVLVKTITLKKDADSTASDGDIENLKLMVDGTTVASAAKVESRFVTFNLTTPLKIAKNNVKRFTVTADAVAGAGKTITFYLDAATDVIATGDFYGYNVTVVNNLDGSIAPLTIEAGKISVEKVNAATDKLKKDTNDVVLGTFKVTPNSGKNIELSQMKLKIVSVNDLGTTSPATSVNFNQIENIEILNKNLNTTYDLAGITTGAVGTKYFQNTSVGMTLNSGTTYEFVVRADVKSTATDGDYEITADFGTSGGWVLKETGNDTRITDITPSMVTLKKVTVETAAATFSTNALSATTNAVVGTNDIEVLNFNVKAGEVSPVKMTQLVISDASTTYAGTNNTVITEVKLWKDGSSTPLKIVSGSQFNSSGAITISDLAETIAANTTNKYKITISLVKDSNKSGKQMKFRIDSAAVEETDKGNTITISSLPLTSNRMVTLVGTGSLAFTTDLTVSGTDKDMYVKGGASEVAVASLKVKATNEDIKITKFTVATTSNSGVTLNTVVNTLSLWDGSTKVAETSNISNLTEFTNVNLVVPQQEKTYTLKATFNKIGKDQAGVLGQTFGFVINNVESEGNSSGDTLAVITSNTTPSKNVTPVATKITAISLESSNSGISLDSGIVSSSTANAAIIKVTTDSTDNTLSDGSTVKTLLSKIKVNVENNVTSYTATIEKIGGTGAVTTSSVSGAYAQFNVSGADYEIAPNTTVYYLVKVTPVFTSGSIAGTKFIRVNLDKFDGVDANDATGGNLVWKDSSDNGSGYAKLLLSTSNATGVKLQDK